MGGSGIAAGTVGLAGCATDVGEEEGDERLVEDPEDPDPGDEDVTLQIYSDADMEEVEDEMTDVLYEAGMTETIDIDVVAGPADTEQRFTEVNSALEAGRPTPDILITDSGWTIPLILREQIVNLERNLPEDLVDGIQSAYVDAAVETAVHPEEGSLYAVPLFLSLPTMLYRRDLVEEAGYDPDGENWATEPMDWQEFSGIAADVLSASDVEYGFTTQATDYEGLSCCTFNETMSSFGGAYFGEHENLFGPVGERPVTVDEEPVINALRMMRSFIYGDDAEGTLDGYEQICPSSIVQWQEEDARGPFADGNAVFHRNWEYATQIHGADPEEEEEGFGEDLGVMLLPYGVEEGEAEYENTGGSRAALGGWHVAVNPNTEHPEATLDAINAMASETFQIGLMELLGLIPPDVTLLEEVTEEEVGPVGRYAETFQLAAETAVPRPVTEIWPEQSTLIAQEVHDAYTDEKTPETAMADLQAELEESEEDANEE